MTLLLFAAAYLVLVIVTNRSALPSDRPLEIAGAASGGVAQRRLTLLDWNLGYAGLGAESEFVADGGNRLLAPSGEIVDKNLAGIVKVLAAHRADVLTLQEVSKTSFLNFWRPVWASVQAALPETASVWLSDVRSCWLPWPVRLDHGIATISRVGIAEAYSVALPVEPKLWFGLLRKQYALLVTRLPIADDTRSWVVVNLHLAAFDENGTTRREQLRAVTGFALGEHAKGNFVVLSGDWNMVLGGREFPHRTEARFLDWVHPLPADAAPTGWRVVFDAATPSVRTLHKPYVPGENFVSIIDGFLVSPNVEVESVAAVDLAFAFSDHHPVLATFRAK